MGSVSSPNLMTFGGGFTSRNADNSHSTRSLKGTKERKKVLQDVPISEGQTHRVSILS